MSKPHRPCEPCMGQITKNAGLPIEESWGTEHPQRHSDIVGVCLDVEIADLVEQLHQIGVHTQYSCQGYLDGDDDFPEAPEAPYIVIGNTAEEAHRLISSALPEVNKMTAYNSCYAFGINTSAAEVWKSACRVKLSFPLGIPAGGAR